MTGAINVEEWLSELDGLGVGPQGDQGALTVQEICEATGHERRWVYPRLRKAIAAGVMIAVRKRIIDLAGRQTMVPAYRAVEVKKKKGKR